MANAGDLDPKTLDWCVGFLERMARETANPGNDWAAKLIGDACRGGLRNAGESLRYAAAAARREREAFPDDATLRLVLPVKDEEAGDGEGRKGV